MASEELYNQMLDLLYDELSEEQATQVRKQLEESELGEEFESLAALRARIAASYEAVAPSKESGNAILAAARKHVEPQGLQRSPRFSGPSGFGKNAWSRAGQVALVATVLLAFAWFSRIGYDSSDNLVSENVNFSSRLSEGSAPAASSSLPPAVRDESPALAAEVVAEEAEEEAFAQADSPQQAPDELKASATGKYEVRERARVAKSSREDVASPEPAAVGRGAVRRQARPSSRTTAPAPRPARSTVELFDSDSAGQVPAPSMDLMEAEAEEKTAVPAQGQPSSIGQVESAWRANDWQQTITRADELLAGDGGTVTERARAMELKAESLVRQGRLAQADNVYAAMQQNYPDYQPGRIRDARSRVQQQMSVPDQERQQRRPAPRKSEYDFESNGYFLD